MKGRVIGRAAEFLKRGGGQDSLWSVGRLGWWFPNFVCGIVTVELWNWLRLFEWWMVCGRLDSLSTVGSRCGRWSRSSWLMRFLLLSYSLSLLSSIASFLIPFSALGGQKHTAGGLLLTVLDGKHTHARMASCTKLTANVCRKILVAKWVHSLYS